METTHARPKKGTVEVRVPPDLAELFPAFLSHRRRDAGAILAALGKGDYAAIRILGHNMIGTGRLYGVEYLTQLGRSLEEAALVCDSVLIRQHATALSQYLSQLTIRQQVPDPDARQAQGSQGDIALQGASEDYVPLTALVADDSDATRAAIIAVLQSMSVEVIGQARNGPEAIARCADLHPDVLFLDVVMPGMSGLHVLEAVRTAAPEVKVVMVTSIAARNTVLQSKALGAYEYILKPFDGAALREEIGRICRTILKAKWSP